MSTSCYVPPTLKGSKVLTLAARGTSSCLATCPFYPNVAVPPPFRPPGFEPMLAAKIYLTLEHLIHFFKTIL